MKKLVLKLTLKLFDWAIGSKLGNSSDLNFYQNLKPFEDFFQISNIENFYRVPENWYVIITDVRGSTQAIKEGRYKQVNMIGASSISAALSVIKQYEFPFVFGGDGATMLIPEAYLNDVCHNLKSLQALAQQDFNLDLRVGYVKVQDIYSAGHTLMVGKYLMSPGNNLAQFKGDGLLFAEKLVKSDLSSAVLLKPDNQHPPVIEGISCRLNPIKSKNGIILSMLCVVQESENQTKAEQILIEKLKSLNDLFGQNFDSVRPLDHWRLRWSLIPRTALDEIRLSYKSGAYPIHFFKKTFFIIMSNLLLIFNLNLGLFKPKKYKAGLVLNSDFKKYDGMLRMVMDCTSEQVQKIESTLQNLYEQKKIFYGIHKSDEALMTCMVYNASQNQHIHFIDGAHGGYALAAIQLKNQMKL